MAVAFGDSGEFLGPESCIAFLIPRLKDFILQSLCQLQATSIFGQAEAESLVLAVMVQS